MGSSTVNLKALGLNFSPNALEVPEGSLVEAKNIIIRRDDVVESRRGFKIYGDSLGTSTDRAKQLLTYKNRIIRHYTTKLEFDDGSGSFSQFSGNYTEAETGLRIKSIEQNGNLYFTTSEGIKKISASSASQFSTQSGYITDAGGVKALDFTASLNVVPGSISGWFPQDSAVAYRVLWGTKDANNNLILGTPSSRVEIYNSLQTLIVRDLLNLLGALDNLDQTGSLITDGNYLNLYKLPLNAAASSIKANLIALASKLDTDIEYTEGSIDTASAEVNTTTTITVIFNSNVDTYISAGDSISLSNFTSVGLTQLNGKQFTVNTVSTTTITATIQGTDTLTVQASTPDTGAKVNSYNYTYIIKNGTTDYPTSLNDLVLSDPSTDDQLLVIQDAVNRIINRLKQELDGVISSSLKTDYIDVLDITTSATVNISLTIPKSVTLSYFYQVYRSSVAYAQGQINIQDITPSDELQLVYEAYPTQADLDNGYATFEDVTPDAFRGANLYTNASTGEGILQANDVPPFAKDINLFKNYAFYANTRTRYRQTISLLGVQKMIQDYNNSIYPKLSISDSTYSNLYSFVTGVAEETIIQCVAKASVPASGYFTLDTPNKNFYVWYDTTGTDSDPSVLGRTGIKVLLAGLPITTDAEVADRTRDVIAQYVDYFETSSSTNTVTITNVDVGYVDDATLGAGMSGAGFSIVSITNGRGESAEQAVNKISFGAAASSSYEGASFLLNSSFNEKLFYIWYTYNGIGTEPGITGRTGYSVALVTGDTTTTIASKTASVINTYLSDYFTAEASLGDLTITNYGIGPSNNPVDGPVVIPSITYSNELAGTADVLLSDVTSPSIAVDLTARSLIRVINKNKADNTYAYYLSGSGDVPGQMSIESKSLLDSKFYILANNSNTGSSFNPDISPEVDITNIATGSGSSTVTAAGHGLANGDYVVIMNTDSIPSIDGVHEVSNVTTNTFDVSITVITSGTSGQIIKEVDAEAAENETRPNRIYYSKIQQPEAVPILNYFEVGSSDDAILRIFPLRDSLFVFKEEGLYRISGQTAPFQVSLFDISCKLVAPDTVSVANNLIYSWTRQGISTVTEAGVTTISRPIDTEIQKISSDNYPDFKTITWGVGYESDNSYHVYTNSSTTDTIASIGYRYSNLTNSWTNIDKSATCGIVNFADDRMYLGAGDVNYIEQERKTFSRLDYADREISTSISEGNLYNNGQVIQLASLENINIGDVITQDQTLTCYEFNQLLSKLDLDPTVGVSPITSISTGTMVTITTSIPHNLSTGDYVTISNTDSVPTIDNTYQVINAPTSLTYTINLSSPVIVVGTTGKSKFNYFNSFKAVSGDNLRTKIVDLASHLDTDPGCTLGTYSSSIATYSGTIISNTATTPTIVTTSASHNLLTGRVIDIIGSDSYPTINGKFSVTVTAANKFTINKSVLTSGTTGSYSTNVNSFDDIKTCYNKIISLLNSDPGPSFGNYVVLDNDTLLEAIITDINKVTKRITLDRPLEFVIGPITIYNAIQTSFTYSPSTMGDPLYLKHVYEATMMFASKDFTKATLSFSSDLLPEFVDVDFNGDGNGIFGIGTGSFGQGYFGGSSHSAPFRTYIPRDKQRCRFLTVKFSHKTAREKYSIYGVTLTANVNQSSRAYR